MSNSNSKGNEEDVIRYPIGRLCPTTGTFSEEMIEKYITQMEIMPDSLRNSVEGLSNSQIDTAYRPGGWTIRQVVHHLADTHMNAYIRFKLALTEDKPLVKTYDEVSWAELYDAKNAPIEISLELFEAILKRWVILLRHIDLSELRREFIHPDLGNVSLEQILEFYVWHGRHHAAHISFLRERKDW